MGINECSKPASKSSWDSQDFGDVNMVLKMVHFRKSSRPQWVNCVLTWWRHDMETLSALSTLSAVFECVEEGGHWWIPLQMATGMEIFLFYLTPISCWINGRGAGYLGRYDAHAMSL